MKRRGWVLLLVLGLPGLGACGGPTTIEPGTAESFQQQVRTLATLTQDGETDRALEQAAELEVDVQAAADSGAVAPGRAARIRASIDSFVESIQPVEPASAPTAPESTGEVTPQTPVEVDAPISPPKQTTADDLADRDEEAAEEEQERAEDEAKERAKQEKEDRKDEDD